MFVAGCYSCLVACVSDVVVGFVWALCVGFLLLLRLIVRFWLIVMYWLLVCLLVDFICCCLFA